MEIGADSQLRVGRDLRQEREERRITLEQVSKATRFSMRHLQSLEADLFDELPAGVVTRKGLIRSYCHSVGLDDDLWIERFTSAGALDQTEPDLEQFAENVHRARLESMPPVRRRWWGVVAMVLGLVALAVVAWVYVVRPRLGPRKQIPATQSSKIETPERAMRSASIPRRALASA